MKRSTENLRLRPITWIVFATLVLSPLQRAFAISDIDYESEYKNVVVRFSSAYGKLGWMKGEAGWSLAYIAYVYPNPKGNIVLVGGFNESFRKYDELSYDLFQKGYSVYTLDHRGQGASVHFLVDSRKGYIDHFKFFISDLKQFVESVVPKDSRVPRFLLAHSMGGAISAAYLGQFPNDFDAAVLSSPMFSLNLGRSEFVAYQEAKALSLIRGRESLPLGIVLTTPEELNFLDNGVNHDIHRFTKNKDIFISHPETYVSAQTLRWIMEAISGSRSSRARSIALKTPTLVFQAGSDQVVLPWGQNSFCQKTSLCQLRVFPGASHEILQEIDSVRNPALKQIEEFFQSHKSLAK